MTIIIFFFFFVGEGGGGGGGFGKVQIGFFFQICSSTALGQCSTEYFIIKNVPVEEFSNRIVS